MAEAASQPEPRCVAETIGVNLAFNGLPILRDVSMKLPAEKVVALIGPNGSGKTTLLRCLLGLQETDSGEIRLFGGIPLKQALPRIGYVPQKLQLDRDFILNVREFLALRLQATRHWFWMKRKALDDRLMAAMAELGCESLMDRPVARLSGGQLQRVLIAFSLLREPELLLLDEPTAGVDTPGEQTFYELIGEVHRRHKMSVVLVSHDLSMVYKHAHHVYALNGNICCHGTPEEVMNAESLKEAYGIGVSPYHHHHHAH
jgi:zinc transport system ATP-binding protein